MINSRKVKKIFVILFLSILLLSTVISYDSFHLVCCHEEECSRCDIIRSSINLLNSVKNVLLVLTSFAITTIYLESKIKRSFKLEKITLVKNKVVLLE